MHVLVGLFALTAALVACGDPDPAATDPCLTTTTVSVAETTPTTTTTTTASPDTTGAPTTTEDPCPPDEQEVAAPVDTTAAPAATTAIPTSTTTTSTTAAPTVPPTSAVESTTTTTVPEADPRGRRFAYTGQIGVFPWSGEFCFPSAGSVTITTPPDATVDLAEVTGDPTAPSGDIPMEVEVTFTPELPTSGTMAYSISAGGAFFEGSGTFEIEWSNFGQLTGTMRLRDTAATATAGPWVVDDGQDLAGIFTVNEVGTC